MSACKSLPATALAVLSWCSNNIWRKTDGCFAPVSSTRLIGCWDKLEDVIIKSKMGFIKLEKNKTFPSRQKIGVVYPSPPRKTRKRSNDAEETGEPSPKKNKKPKTERSSSKQTPVDQPPNKRHKVCTFTGQSRCYRKQHQH